ncbi:MAG: methyltransferase domain-containing protein, partial [Pseudomonadota bacterium]
MADPYADLGNTPREMQETIAAAMAARAIDPAQVASRHAYLSDIALPNGALAVEFGSGTGHLTRDLLDAVGAQHALGIEPPAVMVDAARAAHSSRGDMRFELGNAKTTGLPDASCDMVLMHTLLCHVPGPEDAIIEAARVLKLGGVLAVCDGDYDTATTAIADFDPLEQLVRFMIQENVTNSHTMRAIGPMLETAGFDVGAAKGHGYVTDGDAAYFMTVIDRAAALMTERGVISQQTAKALQHEARDRPSRKAFFG